LRGRAFIVSHLRPFVKNFFQPFFEGFPPVLNRSPHANFCILLHPVRFVKTFFQNPPDSSLIGLLLASLS
ncbi:MAG: hypothetical protein KH459_09485, partial [Oscillospiraceae bacterium]|nr:hypothetical protein [Oscillospiraceae bacterium]